MNYDNFSKLVMSRQACREFNDKPLSRETVDKIVELSRFAPSACNSQPWKMYVACGEMVEKITPTLVEKGVNTFLDKAKAYIVLAEKAATLKPSAEKKFSRMHFVKYDVGELAAYITLTAQSLGVANIVIGWVNLDELKDVVGMDEGEECRLVIALGYSDIPVRDKIRFDREKTIKFID